ncbi:hypothetical protein ACAW74_03575 [Fibrella sp. WM1]|uniref:hypothetical protein n=1 Tax=Fibrella musci TaxID=3242485 RepID=UPI0035211478
MKTRWLLIGIGLLTSHTLRAQTTIRVKGGANWQKAIPAAQRYRYGEFRPGTITFINGTSATGRLNYNLLLGEMQFVNPAGDTLSLADEYNIQAIHLGETMYVYDVRNGYLDVLAEYGTLKLTSKLLLKPVPTDKTGGYGQSSGTSSIAQYRSFAGANGQLTRLEQPGDLLLKKVEEYLIVDANKRVHRTTEAAILKLFARHKSALRAYIEAQNIDFRSEEDLRKLLSYASSKL